MSILNKIILHKKYNSKSFLFLKRHVYLPAYSFGNDLMPEYAIWTFPASRQRARFGLDTVTLFTSLYNVELSNGLVYSKIKNIKIPGVRIWEHKNFLFLSFSVAGWKQKSNLKLVSTKQLNKIFDQLQSSLKQVGLLCDIADMRISRIDLFLDLRVLDYDAMIETTSKIQIPHLNNIRYYKTTLYRGTKSREICVYNKTQQLLDMGLASPSLQKRIKPTLARMEWRYRKTRAVQKFLQLKTVGDLIAGWANLTLNFLYNHITFPIIKELLFLKLLIAEKVLCKIRLVQNSFL